MQPDFLVHDPQDNVGVVVVETLARGQAARGRLLEGGDDIAVTAGDDIPLGHKIALVDIPEGSAVTKYGHDIGRTIAPVPAGGHVHVHNLKTRRW